MHISGGCHCGAIRFEAEVDPQEVGICHCTDCQRLTGCAYRVSVGAEPMDFRVVAGTARRYRKFGASGRPSDQYFCDICGSPLWRVDATGASIAIRLGTIDQRQALTPRHQSWTGSALRWVSDIRDIPASAGE
ncbi:GFA family protein [Rhizobium sp. SL42]|uniref:GFA family protein n=1 Tax=Rhizobium sp. SL42 TaxID=2806346 RepID=UPI001F41BD2F|nr:GFA family protein [Rhizobium sp. SL42]UJW75810.1 GFA family protein [Rhizobium sp. SL42]